MKYTYLVHGAGRQGLAAVYDLLKRCEAKEVRISEPNALVRAYAIARLEELCPGEPWVIGDGKFVDYTGVDVSISCAPYSANLALTEEAIHHGVHFCDLGGNPDVVAEQAKIAANVRTAVVPECGVSPGISNILATHMAMKGAKDIEVRCGGIPANPDVNQFGYKLVFSAAGLMSEYTGPVPIIRGGQLGFVEALSVEEMWDDKLVASPTSNNAPEVVQTLIDLGVEDYNYMTLRYPGHWKLIRDMLALGITREELVKMLEDCEELQYVPEVDTDRLILEVTGSRFDGITTSWEYSIDIEACPRTRFSAMELLTSWGVTITAHQIASGEVVKPGFWTSEKHIKHSKFIAALNRRLVEHDA